MMWVLTTNKKEMEENQIEQNSQNNNANSQKQIAGAIILAGVLIAGAILLKGNGAISPIVDNNDSNLSDIQIKPVAKTEHIFGNPGAKVVVVEYSDLECPFCKIFHNTMHQVVEKNKNSVAWVYRQFPLYQGYQGRPPLHSRALKESEATECAGELAGNEGFWKYTDKLFEVTNSNNSLDPAQLPIIALDAGLDVKAFNLCLSSGKYKTTIDKSIEEGISIGVQGTPKSFILKNGKIIDTIDGAQPLEKVSQKISKALK